MLGNTMMPAPVSPIRGRTANAATIAMSSALCLRGAKCRWIAVRNSSNGIILEWCLGARPLLPFFAVSAPDGRCVVTIRPRESAVVHGGDLLLLDGKPGRSSGSERICNHAIRISSARHGALASDGRDFLRDFHGPRCGKSGPAESIVMRGLPRPVLEFPADVER